MSKAGDIERSVQILAGTYAKDLLSLEICTVNSVNLDEWTCTATPVSGIAPTPIEGIQLSAELSSNGFILVPAVNSNVILAITLRNEVYILMTSEVDQFIFYKDNGNGTFQSFIINGDGIKMGDGSYGGMVIGGTAAGLQAQINNLNNQMQALVNILVNTSVSEPGNGAPSALQIALKAAVATLPKPDFSQILSKFITHGKPLTS